MGSTLAVIASASPASAIPQNCSAGASGGNSGYSYCSSGVGSHRVRLKCKSPQTGNTQVTYGPWVGSGTYSTKVCTLASWNVVAVNYEVQAD